MKDNRGLTLVELLITIAILSIVLITATAFMVTGSNTFAKGNADSKVQKEAELAVNQMEDMIIDVNGGLDKTEDSDKAELVLYNASDEGGVTTYTKEVITWDKTQKQIVCSKWNVSYDIPSNSYVVDGTALYENQLLAEHVTDFKVDLTDKYEETAADGSTVEIIKSVQITAACEDGSGKAAYATSPVITLRNRMMLSPNPTRIFDNTPEASDTLSLYISATGESSAVPIVDRVTEVERTKVYNIYAMIDTGHNVNDLVNWKIEEVNTLSTISGTGLLSVGEFEPNTYLTITASYKSNPTKKVSGVVKVVGGELKSLDAVKIIVKELTPFAPKYISAVTTTGFTESEISALVYKWEVLESNGSASSKVEAFADSGDSLALKVKEEDANYGTVLTIRLKVMSPTTGQTVSDSVVYRIDTKGSIDGDSNMERGKEGNIVYVHYKEGDWPERRENDYYFCDVNGNRISELDSFKKYITVNFDVGGFGFGIKEGLPADREYYVKVEVYGYPSNGNNWKYERIFYIPAVQIYGKTTSFRGDSPYSSYIVEYAMSGYYGAAWQSSQPFVVEVMDLQYDAPEGVVLTPNFSSAYWIDNAKNELGITVGFDCNGDKGTVKLKSMQVRISFRNYPEIYAYSTVLFGQAGASREHS